MSSCPTFENDGRRQSITIRDTRILITLKQPEQYLFDPQQSQISSVYLRRGELIVGDVE